MFKLHVKSVQIKIFYGNEMKWNIFRFLKIIKKVNKKNHNFSTYKHTYNNSILIEINE